MVSGRVVKKNHESRGTSSFLDLLQEIKNDYSKQVSVEINKILGYNQDAITKAADIIYLTATDGLPKELLNANYRGFLRQTNGGSSMSDENDDTTIAFTNLRNKVNNGTATYEELRRYREIEKLL
uniref:Phage protein n=1 Tax=Strongyloides venezuelensis TaxID=75913 RepID=A0A0K0G345_STRVS